MTLSPSPHAASDVAGFSMATTTEGQRSGPGPGLLDLERELVCSVCTLRIFDAQLTTPQCEFSLTLIILVTATDLHRAPLPAPHPARLPPHLLRLLPQGMVLLAGILPSSRSIIPLLLRPALHLPVMPGGRARNEAQRHRHHAAGHVPAGASREGAVRGGEGGDREEV